MNKFYREPTHDEIAELAYALSEEMKGEYGVIGWNEGCDVACWRSSERWLRRVESTISAFSSFGYLAPVSAKGREILKGMVIYNKEDC